MAVTTESQTLRLCNDEAGYAELCQILTPLVVRRRQLVAERQQLSVGHPKAKPSIVQIMDALAAQLHTVDGQLKSHLQEHHADLTCLLTSVKGVGPTTASRLLAL